MRNTELKDKAVNWLEAQSQTCKTRPYQFTPKEVAEGVLGAYTALGHVAKDVIKELEARGVSARYRQGRQKFFELL